MPNFQFVSTNIAHRFPRQIASRLVLSYESVYARTITQQRWPSGRTGDWASGMGFESVGYILLSYPVMWMGSRCPICVQQVLVTLSVGALMLAVSMMIRSALDGNLTGVYLMVGIVCAAAVAAWTYLVPWNADVHHFKAGVQSLYHHEEEAESQRQRDVENALPLASPMFARRLRQAAMNAALSLRQAISPTHSPVHSPDPSPATTPRGTAMSTRSARIAPATPDSGRVLDPAKLTRQLLWAQQQQAQRDKFRRQRSGKIGTAMPVRWKISKKEESPASSASDASSAGPQMGIFDISSSSEDSSDSDQM
jgi:hypothetical protein